LTSRSHGRFGQMTRPDLICRHYLRIGHVYPKSVEDSRGKLFHMSSALFSVLLGHRQKTYSDFSGVFQKLHRPKWFTDTTDSLLKSDHKYCIYPPILQGYMFAGLGHLPSFNSLSLQFDCSLIICDNHTHHFTASFSHLMSISFIGAYCQVHILHLPQSGDFYIFTNRFYHVCKHFLHSGVPSASILA